VVAIPGTVKQGFEGIGTLAGEIIYEDGLNFGSADAAFSATGNFVKEAATDAKDAAVDTLQNPEALGEFVGETVAGIAAGGVAAKLNKLNKLDNLDVKPSSTQCFVAGTLISTPLGMVPIEHIEIGQEVWAYDEVNGQWGAYSVVQTFVRDYEDVLVEITINGEIIHTTLEHPFWVVGELGVGEWLDAADLRSDQNVLGLDGSLLSIDSVTYFETRTRVYNFEVSEVHTYAVSSYAILVHNACGDGRTGKQPKLRELADDPNVSSSDRGWIKQDINAIESKSTNQAGNPRRNIRNPPGKDLAHERGREAAKGYDYGSSNLQNPDLHRTQHKYDNYGRKNKERPIETETGDS
jgi:hypothetical protein